MANGPFSRRRLVQIIEALRGDFEDGVAAAQYRMGKLTESDAAALPQTTDGDLFVVSGGRIVVFGLWVEVTTVIQSQANAAKFRWKPSGGSYGDLSGTADLNAAAVGTCLCVTSHTITTAAALLVGHAASISGVGGALVLPAGTIGLNTAASNTGQVAGRILWGPLDADATVAAA